MLSKNTVELVTYKESPQYLRFGHRFKPAMSEIFVATFIGYMLDYIVLVLLFSNDRNVPIPIFAFAFAFFSWLMYHYKEILLITSKTIEEITETKAETEQDAPPTGEPYVTRLERVVSDDKQLRGYLLAGSDYDALAAYYLVYGDTGFRRDDSVSGKGVRTICKNITTSNFGMLRNALKLEGYIDDKNNWTDEGLSFLGVNDE